MRAVLQRVEKANVNINGKEVANIQNGIVALVAVSGDDNQKTFEYMVDKMIGLRIFEDENGKSNLSLKDMGYSIIVVPNFTVYADARSGKRPSFASKTSVDVARGIFEDFAKYIKNIYPNTQTGVFQADMKVSLINDGPITIILDSDKII